MPMDVNELKYKAVRGAGVNFAAQLATALIQTAGVIVLARILTPRDFGLVAMVVAFSQWLMNFGLNGFTEYIIQRRQLGPEEASSIFWMHTVIAFFLAVIFSSLGYLLVRFYQEPALWAIAIAMSASFVLVSSHTCHLALLKRDLKFTSIAVIQLVAIVLSTAMSIGAALAGLGYWALVIRQLALLLVTSVGAWVVYPWKPSLPIRLAPALAPLKYSVQVYMNFSLKYLRQHIDKVILGKVGGPEPLGHYERAYQLAQMPASQLLTPLHHVAQATLSRLTHDRDKFISFFIKAEGMVALLGTYAAMLLMLTAEDVIYVLLGPDWSVAGKIVMAFAPGIAGMLINGTDAWLHLSLGTPDRWLRWNVFYAALTIVACLAVAPLGPVAMAVAFSVLSNLLVLPSLWYAGRPFRISVKTLLSSFGTYYVSAGLVVGLWLWAAASWAPFANWLARSGIGGRIITAGVVTALFYVLIIAVIERGFGSIRGVVSFAKIFLGHRKKLETEIS